MKCNICGSELTTGDMDNICTACKNKENNEGVLSYYGWICPVCGRGNSPYATTCPCMGFPEYKVTCNP